MSTKRTLAVLSFWKKIIIIAYVKYKEGSKETIILKPFDITKVKSSVLRTLEQTGLGPILLCQFRKSTEEPILFFEKQ